MKLVRNIFFGLIIFIIIYAVATQFFLPHQVLNSEDSIYSYEEPWYIVHEDGTRTEASFPCYVDKYYTVETVIPEGISDDVQFFQFKGQNLNAYLDGELIYSYDTTGQSFFDEPSMSVYNQIPITKADAGKTLRIEGVSDKHNIQPARIGSELGIYLSVIRDNMFQIVISIIMFSFSVVLLIFDAFTKLINKRDTGIMYIALGVLIAALWIIVNSGCRQFQFFNLPAGNQIPKFLVMIMPYPFLFYLNGVQKSRYKKWYVFSGLILSASNIIYILFLLGGFEYSRLIFLYVSMIAMLAVIDMIATFIVDIIKGYIKEYFIIAIGIFGIIILTVVQFVVYFMNSERISGIAVAFGLIWLLVCATISTTNNFIKLESDKFAAIGASEAKGAFLAKMSHEIRTPINAILGMNEMVLRETSDLNIKDYAMDIQTAGRSLLALINDILDNSKIESGMMEIIPAEYDVATAARETLAMIIPKAKAKKLEIINTVDSNIPSKLIGDDLRLRQCLVNLLNNAVKYTEKGTVTMKVDMVDEKEDSVLLRFQVIDTGRGIKEEDMPRLFERFSRIEEEKNRNIEGTGLGMSITIQLLALMGSKLNVESEYAKGSNFYFEIWQGVKDRTPIGNVSDTLKSDIKDYVFETAFTAAAAKILIVDDNSVNRKVARKLLKVTKAQIEEAESGKQCLEMCDEEVFDIILLDDMMPEMDGVTTLKHLREKQDGLNFKTPVIALTANAISGAKEYYKNAGFDGFISKPIVYKKLENALMQFLPAEKIKLEGSEEEKALAAKTSKQEEEVRQLLEGIPEITLPYALMFCENDISFLINVIKDYYEQMDHVRDTLINSYERLPDNDAYDTYRITVHTIKSTSAMIGAMSLSGLARVLEMAARSFEIDTINAVTPVFLNEFESFKEILKPVIKASTGEETEKPEADSEDIKRNLIALKEAADIFDLETIDRIDEYLDGFSYNSEFEQLKEKIHFAARNVDYEVIIKLIDDFLKEEH